MHAANHRDARELVPHLPEGARLKQLGLGGVGCALLTPLARLLHSLDVPARLLLVDGDRFEPRNATRMAFGALGNKAEVKAAETLEWLGETQLEVLAVPEFVTATNVDRLVQEGDIVLLCVDNHQTRRLISERCAGLSNVAVFSGGNDGVEPPDRYGTYGNVQIALRAGGRQITHELTRFHPEIAGAQGEMPGGPGCGELAASMPQLIATNFAVASALLSAFWAWLCGQLTYQEVQFDILAARSMPYHPIASIGVSHTI